MTRYCIECGKKMETKREKEFCSDVCRKRFSRRAKRRQ